uniref:DUF7789 domain-containing protein n=1 Tax=Arion vulgaris TaxID=1028688 RepID=A0A0B6ZMR7_9EUPU
MNGVESKAIMAKVVEPESHITFADMGIPTSDQLQNTVVGKARPFSDISNTEKVYISFVLVSVVATVILTTCRLTTTDVKSTDFTLCIILLINTAFCFWFVFEGVLRERPCEIIILNIATVVIVVYLIANYVTGIQNVLKLAQLIATSIICPALFILGLFITWNYFVSRRFVFWIVGANEALQTFYINLLIFQDFLKFDLQLESSIVVIVMTTAHEICLQDIIILSVGGVTTIVKFIVGYISMPRESVFGAVLFFLLSPAELVYIIYKLNEIFKKESSHYEEVVITIVTCYILTLAVNVIVIITGIIAVINFGKGLKQKLQDNKNRAQHKIQGV